MLDFDASISVGTADNPRMVSARFAVAPGETVAILGPNGAGKSTILRAIAGLTPIDSGRIVIDGRVVDDPAESVFIPTESRRCGLVFQDLVLFEHLRVADNVAFRLRTDGLSGSVARRLAAETITAFGLADLAHRRPSQLSGGERQRVAMARAVVGAPSVLLFDEPFAAIDARARPELRRLLADMVTGLKAPRVLITHDLIDAYVLADRVVVLSDGRMIQTGTLAELNRAPRSQFVADLVGVNLVTGIKSGNRLVCESGVQLTCVGPIEGNAFARIRPTAISLYRTPPDGSARNVVECRIGSLEPNGDRVRVGLERPVGLVAEVTATSVADMELRPGDAVWAVIKATDIDVYPAHL